MRRVATPLLVSDDAGLLQHWRQGLQIKIPMELHSFAELLAKSRRASDIVWLDMNLRGIPNWTDPIWGELINDKKLRIIAASSNPKDTEAVAALDAGCVGYCHAFSESGTLSQIHQVTKAGHVWIGPKLMQQMIQSANRAAADRPQGATVWDEILTNREREIAKLAANGASNQAIASHCDISERTVKAHLSAVFEKLCITDRLQLALKVHGIQ
jgi:DNA-binding NarL/FixJ family response regulator